MEAPSIDRGIVVVVMSLIFLSSVSLVGLMRIGIVQQGVPGAMSDFFQAHRARPHDTKARYRRLAIAIHSGFIHNGLRTRYIVQLSQPSSDYDSTATRRVQSICVHRDGEIFHPSISVERYVCLSGSARKSPSWVEYRTEIFATNKVTTLSRGEALRKKVSRYANHLIITPVDFICCCQLANAGVTASLQQGPCFISESQLAA